MSNDKPFITMPDGERKPIKLNPEWREMLDKREYQMIVAAKLYQEVTPNAGLPGAGLLALIYKLTHIINRAADQGVDFPNMWYGEHAVLQYPPLDMPDRKE